jgi:POT family proton-dependent oligopeptide transporter
MIGALFADRLLGKYPVILWLSLLYCAGHGTLAIAGRFAANESWWLGEYVFYFGLIMIAVGSGGIKPCVSANVGDQFTDKNKDLITKVFQIFYFIINFGSFFATALTPILKDELGPEVAFGVPGVFMGIATIVFYFGRNRFTRVPPNPGGKLGLMDTVSSLMFFTPVIAIIAAVFIVADGFHAPEKGDLSAMAFYSLYVSKYLAYLAKHSWQYFAVSGLLVVFGVMLFRARQRLQQDTGFLPMLLYALTHRHERKPGEPFFSTVRAKFGEEVAEGPPAVLRIMLVFSMVSVFWALFDQHASTWITQAAEMKLVLRVPHFTWKFVTYGTVLGALFGGIWLFSWVANAPVNNQTTKRVLGAAALVGIGCVAADFIWPRWDRLALKPEQLQALNPLMVMMIIPALNIFVYGPLEKRGRPVRPLQKMTVGMFLSAIAFVAAAILQQRIEAAGRGEVHVLWQVVQYVVMTTAEVLVSVTGLEFAYTQAPRKMKSTIMGFWLLGVTFGNVLVAFLAPMETILDMSEFFWIFAGLMAAAAFVFALLAHFYKGKTYLQTASAH